jgi:hypothetical protein
MALPVRDSDLQALAAAGQGSVAVGTTSASNDVARLRDLTWRAHLTEIMTPRTALESVRLMRIGKSEIEANPDGIDLGGAFLETMNRVGILTRQELADPESSAFQQGLEMYREITGTAMAMSGSQLRGTAVANSSLPAGHGFVSILSRRNSVSDSTR